MNDNYYYFSQLEPEWKSVEINGKRKFKKTGNYIPRNWDMCNISAVKKDEKTIKMIVRRKTYQFSSYMQRRIKITFMLSFEISEILHTIIEDSPIIFPTVTITYNMPTTMFVQRFALAFRVSDKMIMRLGMIINVMADNNHT